MDESFPPPPVLVLLLEERHCRYSPRTIWKGSRGTPAISPRIPRRISLLQAICWEDRIAKARSEAESPPVGEQSRTCADGELDAGEESKTCPAYSSTSCHLSGPSASQGLR